MNDFNSYINQNKPTLVDFHATWCGPCKMQGPIIDEVKKTLGDAANILKVDIDANPQLAARYRIQSVPTLILFQRGEAVWRAAGLHQADILEQKIREHIAEESRATIS